ncbi:MAG: T9SS type A sorting domain-containing protein, partial [Bacteroidia bacterium]
NGVTYGYNAIGGFALTTHNTGSQTWSVVDMNNDAKPDLVVIAQLQGGIVTSFSPLTNQYWKVYLNTSTVGFQLNENVDFDIVAYPNPAENLISISIHNPNILYSEVQVLNEQGKLIEKIELDFSSGLSIDIKNYSKGVYFILFMDEQQNAHTIKIIKM